MNGIFRQWRLAAAITLLYLSQGMAVGVAMDALPTMLRHDGASLHALSFLPLVGLPWIFKFLWAPWIDNHGLAVLGRRRSWILPMQAIVFLCLVALAFLPKTADAAGCAVALMVLASLASATQDIASDGMAAEHFEGPALADINAIQVGGVMVGFFMGGSGALVLAGRLGSAAAAFGLLSMLPLLSLLAAAFIPKRESLAPRAGPCRASLPRFARRPGALPLLTLALLSAMTAVSGFGLSKLFLNDLGWQLADIGTLGAAGGSVTIFAGCGVGAWLVRRLGIWNAFRIGVACAALGAVTWAGVALHILPARLLWICLGTALGSLATGFTSVSIMNAGMRFAREADQAGTDVSAVHCARDLGEMIASSFLVAIAARTSYGGGFLVGAVLAVAAWLLAGRHGHKVAALFGRRP
ncbi:RhtX/FptX family siderophore transporter [Bordetella genomosp. 10]|uniref:RhtX/FptX family siderophore transporter n=1 Tax=Bordetella genomosp. 10 TaxID=1416804 RepID=UPI00211B53C6|nr:RhtX/FptX family siderophore transporter [Bordetella genomosp. 10]